MVDETQPDFLQIDEDEDSGVSNFTAFDLLQQPSKFKEELEKQYKVEDDLAEQSKQNYVDQFGRLANYPKTIDLGDPTGIGIFRTPEEREETSVSLSPAYKAGADFFYKIGNKFPDIIDNNKYAQLFGSLKGASGTAKFLWKDIHEIFGKMEMGKDITAMEGATALLSLADFSFVGGAFTNASKALPTVSNYLKRLGVPEKEVTTKALKVITENPQHIDEYVGSVDITELSDEAYDKLNLSAAVPPREPLTAKDEILGLGDDLRAPKQVDEPVLKQEPSPAKSTEVEGPVTIDDILETTRKDLAGREAFEGMSPRDIIKKGEEPDPFLTPDEPISAPKQEKQTVAKDPVVVELKTKIPEFKNLSDAERQVIAQKFVQNMLNPIKRKELVESLSTGELARVERYALKKGLATKELLDISERSAKSVGSFNRMTPDIRKNMAKRFGEINYDELPLGGPDPIRQIINEERKAAGLQEIAPGTEPKTLIDRLIKYGDLDAETAKKLTEYKEKRRVFINKNTRQGGIKTFFDKRAKEKADAALDVINKINKDRETPAKFTAEAFVQELKKEYPDVFVGDYSQKTSRRELIKRLKKIHPEIADSLLGPGQKLKKGTFDISEGVDPQQNIFANLFSTEFKSGQDPVTLLKVDPETRFFNNIRRTSLQSAEDFFETVNLSDIEKGGKYYNDFIRFKEIDKIRLDAAKDLRPLLKKIFSKVLDKPEKSVKASLQIAHRFETKGVKKGYAADKYMKGADPAELYIDLSDYNSVIQPELERRARTFYQKYLDEGLEEDLLEFLEIKKDMEILGIEGQIAPRFKIGEKADIEDKIRGILKEAEKENIITGAERMDGERMVEKIGDARKKYRDRFGPAAKNLAYGGLVEEDLDIFQDDLPEGSYEVANLMLPLFKAFGKAPVNEVAPIPTPKEKLANPTKKQKESLEREKEIRSQEDIFDPTPDERVEIGTDNPIEVTPLTNQPMTSVFYSDIERAMTNAPDQFANKQELLDFLNKNRIKKSEVDDYRINALLRLYDEGMPIPKGDVLSQVRSAPISGMRVHATGQGSEMINPNGASRTRYEGYAKDGFIEGSQRERILYLDRNKLPGDSGEYPQSMFGGERIQRHEFGMPNESDTYVIGWTRLTDRYGFVPPKVEGPQTKINVSKLTKEKTKNDRSLQGLYAEARSKIERLANQRGMSQADINDIMIDFGSDTPKLSVIAKYADQLDEISPGLVNQMDELVVKNNALQEQITKASGVDPSGVVRVTFADEIQSDLLQAAAMRKQQLTAALRKIQEEGNTTNLQGLDKLAEATMDFYEKNKSVFRPLKKTDAEVNVLAQRVAKMDEEVDEIVNKYIETREASDADISRLSTLLNDNLDTMMKELIDIDSNAIDGLFPDLPFKNRDEWADALIKKDLYELAYRKFVLKDPDASSYYAVSPSQYVIDRYSFQGNAATPAAERAADKQRRFDVFKRSGEFTDSKYKGIGMDEFYGGPNAVDEKGKHYTSTIEKILKKQAQSNNSEIITMPVQVKSGRGATQYRVTDQNGNMVATLTNEDQARQLLANPNYTIEPISIPNKKDMEPVFAIKITPEMLEPYKTHKAQGGLVEHIDIFEV